MEELENGGREPEKPNSGPTTKRKTVSEICMNMSIIIFFLNQPHRGGKKNKRARTNVPAPKSSLKGESHRVY